MGAYKRDVVVVTKIGAYIHRVLILCGCLLSQFYGIYSLLFFAGHQDYLKYYTTICQIYCGSPLFHCF